jgi:redox-sensitive bicupin YhaK (pirin superfamily)
LNKTYFSSAAFSSLRCSPPSLPPETSRLLQIWIVPAATGLPPKYEQEAFTHEQVHNRLALPAAPEGKGGLVGIRQDASLYAARFDGPTAVPHEAAAIPHP